MKIVHLSPLRATSFVWRPSTEAWELIVVCRGTYWLRHGPPALADDQILPEEHDRYLDGRSPVESVLIRPSDLIPRKRKADVVLVGHASAAGDAPTNSLAVRLVVAGRACQVDKTVEVFCDRFWSPSGEIVLGEPLSALALSYARASGGPGSVNPAGIPTGMSLAQLAAAGNLSVEQRVPSVVPPGFVPSDLGEPIPTVGLGPLSPWWPERRERLPPAMQEHGLPAGWFLHPLPDGFDFSYFNVAPDDQQLDELLGDEQIVLTNVCGSERLVTSLPQEQPVVFVKLRSAPAEKIQMRCDTVWIDTDGPVFTVTWRGGIPLEGPNQAGEILVARAPLGETLEWDEVLTAYQKLPKRLRAHTSVLLPVPAPAAPETDRDDGDRATQLGLGEAADEPPPESVGKSVMLSVAKTVGSVVKAWKKLTGQEEVPPSAPPSTQAGAGHRASRPTGEVQTSPEESDEAPPSAAAPSREAAGQASPPVERDEDHTSAPAQPVIEARAPRLATLPTATPPAGPVLPFRRIPSPGESTAPPAPADMPPSEAPPPPSLAVVPMPALPLLPVNPIVQPPSSMPEPNAAPPPLPRVTDAPETRAHFDDGAAKRGWKPSGPTRHGVPKAAPASSGPSSATAASNAAASGGHEGDRFGSRLAAAPMLPPKTVIELLWYDPAAMPRLRQHPQWKELLAQIKGKAFEDELASNPPPEKRQELRDRREVAGLLARAEALDLRGVRDALRTAATEDGIFVPPLIVVGGDLELPFDEFERLKATVAVVATLVDGDKKLQEKLSTTEQLLKTPWSKGSGELADGLAAKLAEAYAHANRMVPSTFLEGHTERMLVEQRAYQKRTVMGRVCIRSLLSVPGGQVPVYLPDALGQELPSIRPFEVRMVGEVRGKMDRYETQDVALRAVAMGRVMRT